MIDYRNNLINIKDKKNCDFQLQNLSKNEYWKIDYFEIENNYKLLGEGQFGKVYKTQWRKLDVAIKKIDLNNINNEIYNEIAIWSSIRHPNIVSFLGISFDLNSNPLILLEFMEGGTLEEYMNNNKPSYNKIIKYALDISKGLYFLHNCKPQIIHRDINPSNLLLDRKNSIIKLSDFGISKMYENNDNIQMTGNSGTLRFMAPEVYFNKFYNHKVDVYSFGMILYYLVYNIKPFYGLSKEDLHNYHINDLKPKILKNTVFNSLIINTWKTDFNKRPDFEQIINQLFDIKQKKESSWWFF